MSWQLPTFFDTYPQADNRTASCGACGRRTAADMLVDLATADPPLSDARFVCDGCWDTLLRTRGRRAVLTALGAPPELLALLPED